MRWNLYTRADTPYYQCRLVMEDGTELKRSTRCKDKSAAEEWARKWADEVGWRERLGLSAQTVTVDRCYEEMIKGLPQHKALYYGTSYRNHIGPKFGNKPLDQLKTGEIKQWLQGLPLSGSRIAAIGVVLRKILAFAIERDWLKEGTAPKVPPTTYTSGRREAFTTEETIAILAGLKADRGGGYKTTDQDSRWLLWAYAEFMFRTGMRPGKEVECLRFMDVSVELEGNRQFLAIRIRPETTKVRRERVIVSEAALVPVWEELVEWQRQWGEIEPTRFIFADRRGKVRRFSNEIFRRALERMGMLYSPDGKPRSGYSLRHRKITDWVREGLPLTAIARQAGNSPAIIHSVYDKSVSKDFIDRFIK